MSKAKSRKDREKGEKSVPAFLKSTYDMVNGADGLVRWNQAGDAFLVTNEGDFAKRLLPQFFRHNNISSFVRQLNMYGFKKRTSTTAFPEFSHPCFKRDQPELLRLIKRQQPKTGSAGDHAAGGSSSNTLAYEHLQQQVNELRQQHDNMRRENDDLRQEHDELYQSQFEMNQVQNQILRVLAQFLPRAWSAHGHGSHGSGSGHGSHGQGAMGGSFPFERDLPDIFFEREPRLPNPSGGHSLPLHTQGLPGQYILPQPLPAPRMSKRIQLQPVQPLSLSHSSVAQPSAPRASTGVSALSAKAPLPLPAPLQKPRAHKRLRSPVASPTASPLTAKLEFAPLGPPAPQQSGQPMYAFAQGPPQPQMAEQPLSLPMPSPKASPQSSPRLLGLQGLSGPFPFPAAGSAFPDIEVDDDRMMYADKASLSPTASAGVGAGFGSGSAPVGGFFSDTAPLELPRSFSTERERERSLSSLSRHQPEHSLSQLGQGRGRSLQVRPLNAAEKKHFADFLRYALLNIAFWRFRQFQVRNPLPGKADAYKCMQDRLLEVDDKKIAELF